MPITVTAIGQGDHGYLDADQTPTVQTINNRLSDYQSDFVDRMRRGQYNGPIDEQQLMRAAAYQTPTPSQWAQQEKEQHDAVRESAAQFWTTKGKEAKDRWLSEPKRETEPGASVLEEKSAAQMENLQDVVEPNALQTVDEDASPAVGFMEALHPTRVKNAYQGIMVDLRRWNELPQATALGKMHACFLSPERVGAIVCSCLLMVVLITFIVILTL